uniref:S-adenosyl-L-methionine-dependent tRNA 4-demethylwyosine synthase TYW1 n=1 Tax=Rhinopithecus roxellana TaxID=61622 RepID=A0A2K6QTZ7_RHIRO
MDLSVDTWDLSSPLISLWINRFYIYLGFAVSISLWICLQIVSKTQGFATVLAEAVTSLDLPVAIINLKEYDPDDHLIEEEEEPFESSSEEEFGGEDRQSLNSIVDVEDLGKIMDHVKKEKREKEQQEEKSGLFRNMGRNEDGERRAMITAALREALTKQVNAPRERRLLQTHLLWNESHRCMETTPSLACANKCVFCWRHHTNPVGTEWRWKMDQPEMILKEAVENHQNMIKQFKGVPGVKAERFEEGMTVKHCALSLVGEPIMYPEINRFLKLLHQCKISSFLVTNAQFPAEIRNLKPVTQLYVSVDASTKESLKKIDRPLFKDFWQRFLDSLKALAAKQQRTVYRLTLVKAWNVDELQAYAQLVFLGNPDFIEVKGVTYCGESSASSLTMAHVPWHEEVVQFVRELVDLIPDYEIACEHEHSNCLLIAHKKAVLGETPGCGVIEIHWEEWIKKRLISQARWLISVIPALQ